MCTPVDQAAKHRRTGPSDGCVRGDADRLVHHDHIVVLIDDGHVMGDRFRFGPFLDDVEFYGFACLQGRRFGNVPAEHARLSAFDEVGRLGPGKCQAFWRPRRRIVCRRARRERVRDGSCCFRPVVGCVRIITKRLAVGLVKVLLAERFPRNSSSTAATPASMRKMSATLPMDHP